jgi:hypothetical protein
MLYISLSFALWVPVASLIAAATVLPPILRSFRQFKSKIKLPQQVKHPTQQSKDNSFSNQSLTQGLMKTTVAVRKLHQQMCQERLTVFSKPGAIPLVAR